MQGSLLHRAADTRCRCTVLLLVFPPLLPVLGAGVNVTNHSRTGERSRIRTVLSVLAMSAAVLISSACSVTHEPVLLGYRYSCHCRYDRRPPNVTASTMFLPDGGFSGGAGIGPGTVVEDLLEVTHPCSDYLYPTPEEACANLCPLWPNYGPDYVVGSAEFMTGDDATYEGGGRCDPAGEPPRIFIWPGVPPNAIREGTLDPSSSFVSIGISGVGSANVTPIDGTIAVSGGGCEVTGGGGSTSTCPPLEFHDFSFRLPTFVLGTETVTSARLAHSGTDPDPLFGGRFQGTYDADPAAPNDTWSYLSGSMPLEADGFISGAPMDLAFDYRHDPRDPEGALSVGSGRGVNARQGPGVDKFIQFSGSIERNDIDGFALTIDFDLRFDFWAGAPLVRMISGSSEYSPHETVLDGTATVDDLGGGPVLYEWYVSSATQPGHGAVIGHGPRISYPTHLLDQLAGDPQAPYTDVCLRVWDSDDFYDAYCTDWPPLPSSTPPVEVGCADVGLTWANTFRFRRIVSMRGGSTQSTATQGTSR